MSQPLELRLFGEPCVLRQGRAVALGARKALALLVVLGVQGTARREGVAALLWPALDAAAARRNLRRELFRLRSLDLPLVDDAGAPLQLGAAWHIDVQHFHAALERGDEAAALSHAAAGALIGLDGVAGEAFDAWLHEQRAALQGGRQRARERLARRLAAQGNDAAALDCWMQALHEDACDEAALAEAVGLLADRGEPARALALYDRSADALRQALDAAPSTALQALAATLRRDLNLRAAPPPLPARGRTPAASAATSQPVAPPLQAGAPAPPPPTHGVARGDIAARVLDAWRRRRRVYLSGVPGVGKTRLACDCAARQGGWVRVPCRPEDGEQPFASALRALQVLRDAAPDVELPAWVRRELAPLVPALVSAVGESREMLAGSAARQRLLDAFAHAIAQLARDNFAALVIDDWQWCDADSQALLAPLGLGDDALACVLVFRRAELPPPLLHALRRELDDGLAEDVELTPFDEADTRELLGGPALRDTAADADATALAARLHAATGGNAFFLVETLRHLRERGRLAVDARGRWRMADAPQPLAHPDRPRADALPLPAGVRDAVLGRVRALGDAARRNLEAAALLGGVFDATMLDGLVGTDAGALVQVLEHAEAARLLRPEGDGYHFAHDLVGQCLAESLSSARRQMLHARWAARLAQRDAPPALVALQFEQAGQPTLAVPWRLRAGEAAERVHALADAERQYEQALADRPRADDAVRAHLALAALRDRRGDIPAARHAALAAVQAAADAGTECRVMARVAQARDLAVDRQADAALALLDGLAGDLAEVSAVLQARALIARGNALRTKSSYAQAEAVEAQAIALLEQAPDALSTLGDVLDGVARRQLMTGQAPAALATATRAVAALEAADRPHALARTLMILGVAHWHAAGDAAAAEGAFERMRVLAARCGDVELQRGAILNLVKAHTDRGDAATAQALLDEGEALLPRFVGLQEERGFAGARYFVAYMRGQVEAAAAAAQRLVAVLRSVDGRTQRLDGIHQVLDLFLHVGRLNDAQALLDEASAMARDGEPPGLPLELRLKTAWLQRLGGDTDGAQATLAALEATAETVWALNENEAALLHARVGAEVALARGDTDTAARHLARARLDQDMPIDFEALLLAQHLALARRGHGGAGADATVLRQRAQALLASGRVPFFEGQALRRALQPAR